MKKNCIQCKKEFKVKSHHPKKYGQRNNTQEQLEDFLIKK